MIQLCGIKATTNCKEAMAPCLLKALGSSLTKGNISSRPPTAYNCKPDMESTEDLLWTGQWRGGLQVDSDEIVHSYGCWLLQQDYYGAWSSLLIYRHWRTVCFPLWFQIWSSSSSFMVLANYVLLCHTQKSYY